MGIAEVLSPEQAQTLQDALDLLGVALADHEHQWTADERSAYDNATKLIKALRTNWQVEAA